MQKGDMRTCQNIESIKTMTNSLAKKTFKLHSNVAKANICLRPKKHGKTAGVCLQSCCMFLVQMSTVCRYSNCMCIYLWGAETHTHTHNTLEGMCPIYCPHHTPSGRRRLQLALAEVGSTQKLISRRIPFKVHL